MSNPQGEGSCKSTASGLLSLVCGKSAKDDKKKECDEGNKCPPMPCFNTADCKPDWLCNPPKPNTKTYPVPEGVTIVPISVGGRFGSSGGGGEANKCSSCGNVDNDRKAKSPQVKNKDCPMLKPRCPNKAVAVEKKESAGLFSKFAKLFGKEGETDGVESINCESYWYPAPNPVTCDPGDIPPVPVSQEGEDCAAEANTEAKLPEDVCGCGCYQPVAINDSVNQAKAAECAAEIPANAEAATKPEYGDSGEAFVKKSCGCPRCDPPQPSFEPIDLPEPDDRNIEVRASELKEECDCSKCKVPIRFDENGEPIPVRCPSVTCGECGYVRGDNVNCCHMCRFAVAMKEEKEYMRKVLCPSPCPADADAIDDCAPEVNPDDAEFEWALGKPKYEGGMSLRRLQKFLWEQSFCDGEGFKSLAIEGQSVREVSAEDECTCEEHMKRLKYRGGMSLEEAEEWLWIKNKFPPQVEGSPGDEPLEAIEEADDC